MILFLSTAFAVPDFPSRPEPVPNECLEALPVVYGNTPSEDFIEPSDFTYNCSGVVVPTSQVAHLLAVRSWAEAANAQPSEVRSDSPPSWSLYTGIGFVLGAAVGVCLGSH
tara:strand:+ start:440 stop:772 length:333 start_codon:yes stop_codon:yes gene_type:complete